LIAAYRDWRAVLSPGELGHVFVVAVDKAQAAIIKRYVRAILDSSPSFRKLVKGETQETISLFNNVNIGIKTSSFRSVRGFSLIACVMEELAFWRSEDSANPDKEILAALRPALSTVKDSLLIGISTPYSKSGSLYQAYRDYFGHPGGPLIWKAESTKMNPTLDQAMIQREIEQDPEAAKAEWLAEFRSDVSSFIPYELVESAVIPERHFLPWLKGVQYFGFTDPSGGRSDSFTLAISHKESNGKIILDVLEERKPPFSPENVVEEFSAVLKNFGLSQVSGDSYSASWCSDSFRKNGVLYLSSEKSASELYISLLPLLASSKAELLDQKKLRGQLTGLERRVRAGGKDLICHGPGLHDDLSNACAGAICLAASEPQRDGLPEFVPPEYAKEEGQDEIDPAIQDWLMDRKPKKKKPGEFNEKEWDVDSMSYADIEKALEKESGKGS